ncbi:uncharacterized protein LOC117592684 [Drosophila guanche]|uniref:uncharacterized protein LOC117592684 n=1 Tax=Drosophila guanche TaxID=7266 RepID=UPI00147218F0|nr:uncharacterized protein LOC117592684 [Drosophila guanche]
MASRGIVVLLFGLFLVRVDGQLSDISNQSELHLEETLMRLLLRLRLEEDFDTLLIYGQKCVFHALSKRLGVSTMLVLASSGSTDYDWNFSSSTLILGCGAAAEKEGNFRTSMKLQMRRRLLYIEEDMQPENVCENHSIREQHNVAMVKVDFVQSGSIYTCRCFQEANFEELQLIDHKPIFVEQFKNMRGATIKTLADQLVPRSMSYRDERSGEEKMVGYVANLMNSFAQKVNARLHLSAELRSEGGKATYHGNISKWAGEDLLDIGMSLATTWLSSSFDTLTYPYLTNSFCFMVPLPPRVPYRQLYTIIVDPLVLGIIFVMFCLFSLLLIYSQELSWRGLSLANVLLNDKSLRGLLGQSYPFPRNSSKQLKLVCSLLCFASVMMTTMYEAYLQSIFTSPPSEPMLRAINDVQNSRYKVAINGADLKLLHDSGYQGVKQLGRYYTHIIDDYHEFVRLRASFNTSFIFPVTDVAWYTYEQQQKIFAEPVFYFSDDICINRFFFLSLPVRRHLPYRELFEEHMLRQKEFGFVKFWVDRSFYEMVRLRLMPMKDLSSPEPPWETIYFEDLSWILSLYVVAMLLCCFCFFLELWGSRCCSKWRRCRTLN